MDGNKCPILVISGVHVMVRGLFSRKMSEFQPESSPMSNVVMTCVYKTGVPKAGFDCINIHIKK